MSSSTISRHLFSDKIVILLSTFGFTIIYFVIVSSLNLNVPGDGFSPFNIWDPFQSIFLAFLGILLLMGLLILDDREKNLNPKGIVYFLIVLFLSTLIVFVWEPQQILEHVSLFKGFYFLGFGSLLLFGGLLGILFTLIWSLQQELQQEDSKLDLSFTFLYKSFIVVFIFPLLILFPLYIIMFMIRMVSMSLGFSDSLTLSLPFPFYGEGTSGSILVVLTLLAMYFGARLLGNVNITAEATEKLTISRKQVGLLVFEILTAYICITAGFSLMGGLITDGLPPPLQFPLDFVILIVFLLIPFSFFISRDKFYSYHNYHEDTNTSNYPENSVNSSASFTGDLN